jgi:large subunit ribosomal protein L29
MPSKRAQHWREFTDEELIQQVENLQKEVYQLKVASVTDRVDNPHLFKKHKRDIARILTILRERAKSKELEKEKKNEKT